MYKFITFYIINIFRYTLLLTENRYYLYIYLIRHIYISITILVIYYTRVHLKCVNVMNERETRFLCRVPYNNINK